MELKKLNLSSEDVPMENLELTGKVMFDSADDDFDEEKYHFDLNELSKKERCIYYAGRNMATVELILELYVHKVPLKTIAVCCYKSEKEVKELILFNKGFFATNNLPIPLESDFK